MTTEADKTQDVGSEPPDYGIQWEPRPYQAAAYTALASGIKRFFLGWHRRAGKDTFGLNFCRDASRDEIGSYWHLFPLHSQARRAIWKGINRAGQKFIDQAFPDACRAKTDNQEMFIEFKWGSTFQMLGCDYYDRLVGSNPKGVLFSEFALCDPRAWDYILPILIENGGWAGFITTYRGRNHAYQMAQLHKTNPRWYVDIRDITQTSLCDGSPVLTHADVDAAIADGMSRQLAMQEFYMRPIAGNDGAYYGRQAETLISVAA